MNTVAVVISVVSLVLIFMVIAVRCGLTDKWKKQFNERLEARKQKRKEKKEAKV